MTIENWRNLIISVYCYDGMPYQDRKIELLIGINKMYMLEQLMNIKFKYNNVDSEHDDSFAKYITTDRFNEELKYLWDNLYNPDNQINIISNLIGVCGNFTVAISANENDFKINFTYV